MFSAAVFAPVATASETDQFTLPPAPLDDIGPDLSARTLDVLTEEIAAINVGIDDGTFHGAATGVDPALERRIVDRLFQRMGFGLPEATTEIWVRYASFGGRNVRFLPSPFGSIYAWVPSPLPLAFAVFNSPTIRLYGVDLGTDKVGHFYQQGAGYYERYSDARTAGASEEAAVDAVVRFGVQLESTIFGIGLTGVYSNADLAADYAGFKFFRNLFREVTIAGKPLAPIIVPDGSHWAVNRDRAGADLLRPYVSDHMNEAYNPSRYTYGLELLRSHVRERCTSWLEKVPDFNEQSYRAHLERAKTWFGEPYGWDLPDGDAISLLECFRAPDPPSAREKEPSPLHTRAFDWR